MQKVVIYARCALKQQHGEIQMEEQLKNLRQFVKENKLKVIGEYYDDGTSEGALLRPALSQLWQDM